MLFLLTAANKRKYVDEMTSRSVRFITYIMKVPQLNQKIRLCNEQTNYGHTHINFKTAQFVSHTTYYSKPTGFISQSE